MPSGQRLRHGIGIHCFHTNNLDLRAYLLDRCGHTGNQTAAAHTAEHGLNRFRMLAHDLQTHGTLAGNHIRIIKGVHKGQAFFFFQTAGFVIGIVKRIAKQHHLATARTHGIHLNARRRGRHHNHRTATQLLGGQCHTLGMVTGRSRHHPALQRLGR